MICRKNSRRFLKIVRSSFRKEKHPIAVVSTLQACSMLHGWGFDLLAGLATCLHAHTFYLNPVHCPPLTGPSPPTRALIWKCKHMRTHGGASPCAQGSSICLSSLLTHARTHARTHTHTQTNTLKFYRILVSDGCAFFAEYGRCFRWQDLCVSIGDTDNGLPSMPDSRTGNNCVCVCVCPEMQFESAHQFAHEMPFPRSRSWTG